MSLENIFERLKEELKPYKNMMSQAAATIIRQDISEYPVFIVHQQAEVQIGIPLVAAGEGAVKWGINASTLEELMTKGVVATDKVREFQSVFKDPSAFFCLFVITEASGHFAFMPKKDDIV